jgi:hypothetical protein
MSDRGGYFKAGVNQHTMNKLQFLRARYFEHALVPAASYTVLAGG